MAFFVLMPGRLATALLLVVGCVDVRSLDFPASGSGSLILVEPTGPAVAAVELPTSRQLLLAQTERLETWAYTSSAGALGIRTGLMTVDAEKGCPLPKPDALFRLEGAVWNKVELESRSPVLVSAADVGLAEQQGTLFLDLSCATTACGLPATYSGCHLEFRGPGCGIPPFDAFLDLDGLSPRSVLSQCRPRPTRQGARLSYDCLLNSEVIDVPPIPCSMDAYDPVPEPKVIRSVDLHSVVPPSPVADVGGIVDLGDALWVALSRGGGDELFECDPRFDTYLIELDRQTLEVRSSTPAPSCLKGLTRAGEGFVATYIDAELNWWLGRFDQRARLQHSVPLPLRATPGRKIAPLRDGRFALFETYERQPSDVPCPSDGSLAWSSGVIRFGADLVLSSTVVRAIPGELHPCGVGLTAVEELEEDRLVGYDQFSRRFLLFDFEPSGRIAIHPVEGTPDTRRRILGELARVGPWLLASGGGDHSVILTDLESLSPTTIPMTRPVFPLGRSPRVDALTRIDDHRALAMFKNENSEGGGGRSRIEILELSGRPHFVPDGVAVGIGRAHEMLLDPSSGDVRVVNRSEHVVYLLRGFVSPRP